MVNSKALGRSGYRRGSLSICRRREERIDQELPPLRTFLFEQDQGIDRTKVVERTGLTREFALHPPPEGATFLATHARTTRSEVFLFLFIYFIFYVLSGGRSRIYSHPDDYASFHLRGIFFFLLPCLDFILFCFRSLRKSLELWSSSWMARGANEEKKLIVGV